MQIIVIIISKRNVWSSSLSSSWSTPPPRACCRKENDAEKTKLEFETTTERKKEARKKKTLSKLSLIVVCRLPESIVVASHGGFLIWLICCKREFVAEMLRSHQSQASLNETRLRFIANGFGSDRVDCLNAKSDRIRVYARFSLPFLSLQGQAYMQRRHVRNVWFDCWGFRRGGWRGSPINHSWRRPRKRDQLAHCIQDSGEESTFLRVRDFRIKRFHFGALRARARDNEIEISQKPNTPTPNVISCASSN